MPSTPRHPLGEVFGFPTNNFSPEADRYRGHRLCPFGNKVPNCTKDKAENPLGVCSVKDGTNFTITCPVRFRQNWIIADDAAAYFFPSGALWTSLTEIRLNDTYGKSAGNIDVVLVSYDTSGRILDFGALEIQAVYISGNIRQAFAHYMDDPHAHADMDWSRQRYYPRPDFLSSSRKRLAPQLIYKGGILNAWRKKTAVALDATFYHTLPNLPEVDPHEADIAWMIYDLQFLSAENRYQLVQKKIVYTQFGAALDRITRAEPGPVEDFIGNLQQKLDEKLDNGDSISPDAPTLQDIIQNGPMTDNDVSVED
jgi:hypothetical protein